jgi:hypothetical protein
MVTKYWSNGKIKQEIEERWVGREKIVNVIDYDTSGVPETITDRVESNYAGVQEIVTHLDYDNDVYKKTYKSNGKILSEKFFDLYGNPSSGKISVRKDGSK